MTASRTSRTPPMIASVALLASVLLAGCAAASFSTASTATQAPANARCAAMQGAALKSGDFGLPTGGAVVDTAALILANAEKATPEWCQLNGTIQAAIASDLPIRFQLNLPTSWNGKAVQFGGAGSNGVVITATGAATHAPAGVPTPLMRGYATFGGDSGHSNEDPDWLTNKQAYANFAGESVKRTRDAAIRLIERFYSATPRRTYFIGGSKGGHEGLVAAQRYGADYDGIIAYYPAAAAFAMQMSWGRMGYAAQATPEAKLSASESQMVKRSVLQTCDGLDGAEDGLISNVKACRAGFQVDSLRCRNNSAASESCLSAAQIAGLKTAASPLVFDFPLSGGLTRIGPYPIVDGADFGGWLYGDRSTFVGAVYRNSADDLARQVSGDRNMTWPEFDYRKYRSRIEALSALYDASSTDLAGFAGHGGRLLLLQGTTDMLVPEDLTSGYWQRLRRRYGNGLDRFARYYIQPGFSHGGGDFALVLDSLTLLEQWVERDIPPERPTARDGNVANGSRTRPLCDYPEWPRYRGAGDMQRAASFECVAP